MPFPKVDGVEPPEDEPPPELLTVTAPRLIHLVLGYDETQTSLINELRKKNCSVTQTKEWIDDFSKFDLVISFGYTHIIKKILISSKREVLNLNLSFLPL